VIHLKPTITESPEKLLEFGDQPLDGRDVIALIVQISAGRAD